MHVLLTIAKSFFYIAAVAFVFYFAGGVMLRILDRHPEDCNCVKCDTTDPWDDLGEGLL